MMPKDWPQPPSYPHRDEHDTAALAEDTQRQDFAHAAINAEDEAAHADEQAVLSRHLREAKAREIAAEIQHGKTPSKTTVATQVRILADQLADLKHIANLTDQNISSILRELIAEYILRMREDEYVARSLDWARGGREAVERMRKTHDE